MPEDSISIDEFKKLDLRTAKVVDVQEHPNADRLWVVKLQLSDTETKEVVAGIKSHYPKETLMNKTVVVVNNLKPTTIRGVASNGMILVAKNEDTLSVLTTDKEISAGSKVS